MSPPFWDETDGILKGRRPGDMAVAETNSSHLVIDARDGFFHAMLSYRMNSDAGLVFEIHDKLHLLAPNAGKSVSQVNQLLDSSPFPQGFKRDRSTLNSSLRVFLDAFCLRDAFCFKKDGMGWEGDGDAKSGGSFAALRLSPVFVPLFSATEIVTANSALAQQGSGKGSVGQMIGLAHKDMLDHVLLELIVARELHLISKKNSKTKKLLFPCSYIFPLFRQNVWSCGAASSLPKIASALTNAKAKEVMKQMDIPDEFISEELYNGTLTVRAVWEFFMHFQGIKLYDRGEERFQVAAAANAIFSVIEEVRHVVDYLERQVSAGCMRSRRCNLVLQPHVHLYFDTCLFSQTPEFKAKLVIEFKAKLVIETKGSVVRFLRCLRQLLCEFCTLPRSRASATTPKRCSGNGTVYLSLSTATSWRTVKHMIKPLAELLDRPVHPMPMQLCPSLAAHVLRLRVMAKSLLCMLRFPQRQLYLSSTLLLKPPMHATPSCGRFRQNPWPSLLLVLLLSSLFLLQLLLKFKRNFRIQIQATASAKIRVLKQQKPR
jgi:hypothetical protein